MGIRLSCMFVLILGCLWTAIPARSQDACPAPSYTLPAKAANIFSEQQENDLGDAVAESLQRRFRVIDDEVTSNLRRIGQRLLSQLPLSHLRIQFYLVDYPEANAVSLPGGRVYVTRKMVAFCRSEDELAGVVAHELGHVITRHTAINYTYGFKKILGITSVGDRKDIFEKLNQFADNLARNPGVSRELSNTTDEEQITADPVSLYLAKRAGYAPEAIIQLWDRLTELHGKAGSSLGDFFGITRPEQKRLREMQRLIEQIPAACSGSRTDSTAQQFEEWKTAVLSYSGLGHRESLPAAEWKRELKPRLRGNITHMRFSWDGKYLLAQDSTSIFVLSREPFKFLFQVEAQNALPAQFAPDSQSLNFHTQEMRVETWSIPEERRTGLWEMSVRNDCNNTKLSPDAKYMACLDTQRRLTLYNVSDGSQIYQKNPKIISTVDIGFAFRLALSTRRPRAGQLEFSPDGRYFLGVDSTGMQPYAYDLVENKPLKLPESITSRMSRNFAFMSGNRFVGVAGKLGDDSAVVRFPSGEVLYKFQVGLSTIYPATQGDYIIMRPIEKFAAGVMDLAKNKIFLASKESAIDLYDKSFAAERQDGILFLFNTEKEEALGKTELPQGPLPRPSAVSLSPDLNWLAVSEPSRGAIWDLRKGAQVFLSRNFQGSQFTDGNTLIIDLPKSGDEKRMIVRINPAGPSVTGTTKVFDRDVDQEGLYLVDYRKDLDNLKIPYTTVLAVSNAETGRELWSRKYPKGFPWANFNSEDDKAVFVWSASSEFVKDESKDNPDLKKKIEATKELEGDYYIQVVQASTGNPIGKLYVETGRGSFALRWAEADGDYLTLYDNNNRLLVYSISSGKRIGQIFGANGDVSPSNQLLAAENKIGVITLYSLPSMEERGKLVFGHAIAYVKFSKDGTRLFVLTKDQSTYLFNTERIISSGVAEAKAGK